MTTCMSAVRCLASKLAQLVVEPSYLHSPLASRYLLPRMMDSFCLVYNENFTESSVMIILNNVNNNHVSIYSIVIMITWSVNLYSEV